uniref:Uncharacterized protein n=1 Tax=Anas platyrhynchos platyrhynchos TaxID=8840 RepID=A0A493T8K9_ANAPP
VFLASRSPAGGWRPPCWLFGESAQSRQVRSWRRGAGLAARRGRGRQAQPFPARSADSAPLPAPRSPASGGIALGTLPKVTSGASGTCPSPGCAHLRCLLVFSAFPFAQDPARGTRM